MQQAQSELRLVEAKLGNVKRNYQYQSYEYSLELSKRDISIQQQELEHQRQQQEQQQRQRDRDFQIAQVTAQLQNIETQLAALSIVRSLYNGKIQRVKWLGQDNQNLAIELTLITGDLRNLFDLYQDSMKSFRWWGCRYFGMPVVEMQRLRDCL